MEAHTGDLGEIEEDDEPPFYVEVWNDYDPSMRFVALFPVGEDQGATQSSAAYYIIEPGKHTGLHSDNAEEIVFVAEGQGETFAMGTPIKLEAGTFVVLPAGTQHDIYAHGAVALRLLSFFPATEILSTFQQTIYPVGGNVLSSRPPQPVLSEFDPQNLPEDFPFALSELGLEPTADRRPTPTEVALGLFEPPRLVRPSRSPGATTGSPARSDTLAEPARAWRNWQTRRV